MSCSSIEHLVTPYIDGELPATDRRRLEQHLDVCAPCKARIGAEQVVRHLLRERRARLQAGLAPGLLVEVEAVARTSA